MTYRYQRFKVIEFDELIDRFKKELHTKAMNLSMKIFDVKTAVGELIEKNKYQIMRYLLK